MQSYTIKENFIAVESQQEFRLGKPFVQGTINVYLNGALQSFGPDLDYVTLPNSGKIIFNKEILGGDIISVITNEKVNAIKIMSYGKRDTANALFQRYSSDIKLNHNNRYKIHMVINGEPIDWSFSTALTPYWSSIKKIQEDIGEFIPGFSDEYIASMIHRNSWELLKRISEAEGNSDSEINESVENLPNANPENEYESTSRLANNWVRYKTEIDLIYARYFGISFKYGTVEKSIGDIKIRNERKLPYIDNLLDRLNKSLKDTENAIFGSMNIARAYQKGSTKYDYETVARTVIW